MLLENRTNVVLKIEMGTQLGNKTLYLEPGNSRYFGEFSEGDYLEINSSEGQAKIVMLSDEKYMWQIRDDAHDDFVSEAIKSQGNLKFEEIFYGRGRQQNRKANGICIQVTV